MPKKILVIGYVWPEPNSSAAGKRMMQLLEYFLLENHAVTFATTAAETPYMVNLKSLGIKVAEIELNNESFNLFLKELQPDIVLFDRFMMEEQFGWRVGESCPGALKILDTEDLHFLRTAREAAVKKGTEINQEFFRSTIAKREIASIFRCDLSLIISTSEMNLLVDYFKVPKDLLFHLPLFIEEGVHNTSLPSFEERHHFVTIGNFRHKPNVDAVVQLKEKIWPIIRKELPKAELHIFGAYPTDKIFLLEDKENGFLIKGRAESASEVLRKAAVLLAPLRFGAGLKGKLLDAMANGIPSVTTRMGAEAMHDSLKWNGIIEDDNEAFARAAIELYSNRKLWESARENGFKIIDTLYSGNNHRKALKNKLNPLLENMQEHREKNFIGQMLKHHTLQSTRYLSKYIEVKNKLERENPTL